MSMAAKTTAIRLTTEAQLKSELKQGRLRSVYFLCGEEPYLTALYRKKIVQTALGGEPDDMNYTVFNGAPDFETLSDHAESMPYFSEYKVIVISEMDADKLDNKQHAQYLELLSNLPETTVLIISQTAVEVDLKKPKAKLKKLLEKIPILSNLYLLIVVTVGWVIFRFTDIPVRKPRLSHAKTTLPFRRSALWKKPTSGVNGRSFVSRRN